MSSQNKNEGKPRLGLVLKDFSNAIEALARLRENNLKKYDRDNWAESIGTPDAKRFLEENLESIQRHVSSMWKGEELDPENCDHHATAIMCRVCFILEYYYRQKEQREIDLASLQAIESEPDPNNMLASEPEVFDDRGVRKFDLWPAKKTIYDWSKIPTEYNWCATDQTGEVYAFPTRPRRGKECFLVYGPHKQILDTKPSEQIDWQDSLEARPT